MTINAQRGSHAAIHLAFAELVLSKRYSEIQINEILLRAGVARSTFYQHFASKDALLTESLQRPFSTLISALEGTLAETNVERILLHFWQHRALARNLMQGEVYHKVVRALANQLLPALKAYQAELALPIPVVALAYAEMMLSSLREWLAGRLACSSAELARAFCQWPKSGFGRALV